MKNCPTSIKPSDEENSQFPPVFSENMGLNGMFSGPFLLGPGVSATLLHPSLGAGQLSPALQRLGALAK
jgi:hypothetical protein